jgi:hypothetical protein
MNQNKLFSIKNALIDKISLVKRGANRKKFFLKKSESEKLDFKIMKSDKKDWSIVKGVIYEPEIYDTHGHKMSVEDIQKMAHSALKGGLTVDIEHNDKITKNSIVESYITEKDDIINGQDIKKGSWVGSVEIVDIDIKKAIDNNEITGFSMAGQAVLEEVEKSDSLLSVENITSQFNDIVKEIFKSDMNQDDIVGNIDINLNQLNTSINELTDKFRLKKRKRENESKIKKGQKMEEKDIVSLVTKTVSAVFKAEKEKEQEAIAKSDSVKEITELKKTVEELKKRIVKSDAGKDGEEVVIEKTEEVSYH